MSSFYGKFIQYAGVSSETFGLRIVDFDTGESDGTGGAEPTLFQDWVINRSKVYFYRRSFNTPLQMTLTLAAENEIDAASRSLINRWLLGRSSYLPLIIQQADLLDVTFNVLFKKVTPKYIGNLNIGLVITGDCDSPFGYQYPQTTTKTYSGLSFVNETFNYLNTSDSEDYLYPSMIFHTSGTSGGADRSFYLTNNSNASRITSFTALSASEIMTIDNSLGTMSSSTGLLRMPNFNKQFFRLIPGNNSLTLSGSLVSFSFTTSFPREVGA